MGTGRACMAVAPRPRVVQVVSVGEGGGNTVSTSGYAARRRRKVMSCLQAAASVFRSVTLLYQSSRLSTCSSARSSQSRAVGGRVALAV